MLCILKHAAVCFNCDQSKNPNMHVVKMTSRCGCTKGGRKGDDCIISCLQGQGLPGFYGNKGDGPAVMVCRKKRWNKDALHTCC